MIVVNNSALFENHHRHVPEFVPNRRCCCDVTFSSCIRALLSKRHSRPVGCSGAKNRCGRSSGEVSPSELWCLPLVLRLEVPVGLVGVQSISSSPISLVVGGVTVVGFIEETPKIGLTWAITGFEERDRVARASCSGRVGDLGMCGVGERTRVLWAFGVVERDLLLRWEWVSTNRIEGGCCSRRRKKDVISVCKKGMENSSTI